MTFTSIGFYVFLIIVFVCFYYSPTRHRWIVLLVSSILFYFSFASLYLLIVLVYTILVSYFGGIWINKVKNETQSKWILVLLVILTLAPLVSSRLLSVLDVGIITTFTGIKDIYSISALKHLTTIGVSFYTFQALSYIIDVYLEKTAVEYNLGFYSLYLSFFPKLVQGPIERSTDLIPQLHKPYEFQYESTRAGILRISWGLFKKLVIAERIGLFINPIFSDIHSYSGFSLILTLYLYAFQIYFDFSGYTDIALGIAKLFNINLTENFYFPYLATSIADFWRRWHISFSRWILDYIFNPLQLNWRNWKNLGSAFALLITFFVSGLWHGVSIGFVIWGLLHGIYMATYVFWSPWERKIEKRYNLKKSFVWISCKVFFTFNIVCFSWIFFRANTVQDALYIVSHLFSGLRSSMTRILSSFLLPQGPVSAAQYAKNSTELIILSLSLIFMIFITIFEKPVKRMYARIQRYTALRWFIYYIFILCILLAGIFEARTFLYTQF